MKKLMYGGLFLALVGIGFMACKKEISSTKEKIDFVNTEVSKNTKSDLSTHQKSLESEISSLSLKMLKATNVNSLNFIDNSSGKIKLKDGESGNFNVSNNKIHLKFSTQDVIVNFDKSGITINNLVNGTSEKYDGFSDIISNIDRCVPLALAIGSYVNEMETKDYADNSPTPSGLTHWCIYPRKSSCNRAHVMNYITNYCGGTPSWVGDTDFGCIWGDFGCVGVTDFEC